MTVTLYRVEIRDTDDREWYTRVEADTPMEARKQARRHALMLGDTITAVDGPHVVDISRCRWAHGWHPR
jgi:hypothetical protein